jgi:biopolymer transport protein ExbD
MLVPRHQIEKARIEIIPMIDIIFFLLVFFMVSTLAMTINRGLPVNLPKAASSQTDLRESFNVTVMQDGSLFLNKEPTTLEQLGQQVRASVDRETELVVIINADDQALHGAIVSVMDEVRLAGVSRLAIAVKPDRRGGEFGPPVGRISAVATIPRIRAAAGYHGHFNAAV